MAYKSLDGSTDGEGRQMNTQYARIAELTRELIALPTLPGREDLGHALLKRELMAAGCQVHVQPVPGTAGNLIATRGQGGPWLVTHLDVFPPYDHPDPFTLKVEGDVLIGRGAVDTKGQIAALLLALQHSTGPVQVALVADEERLGRGSAALQVPEGVSGAVVLEPTRLRPAVVEAGSFGLSVAVVGRAAHGTTPWAGESAVHKAIAMYTRLLEQPFLHHHHPLFPRGAWVNLGRIEGGEETMVVPARCRLELDVGFTPGLNADSVHRQVREAFHEAAEFHVVDLWEPWETREEAPILAALNHACAEVLGKVPRPTGMPSWTDGGNLVRKGVDVVTFGAGDLALAHSARESVPLSDLLALVTVLATLFGGSQRRRH